MRRDNRLLAMCGFSCVFTCALMMFFATESNQQGNDRASVLFLILAAASIMSSAWCLKRIFKNLRK